MGSSQYRNPQVVKGLRIRNCVSSAPKINPFTFPAIYPRLPPSKVQGSMRKKEGGKKSRSHRTGRTIEKCWHLDRKWLTHSWTQSSGSYLKKTRTGLSQSKVQHGSGEELTRSGSLLNNYWQLTAAGGRKSLRLSVWSLVGCPWSSGCLYTHCIYLQN